MRARELERMLTTLSGYQPGEIDQRTRPLREHNLIPFGPRGVHAPTLEPLHAALMVLCMVSRRATDAGEVMARAMDLRFVARAGASDLEEIIGVHQLAPTLAAGLTLGAKWLQRVEITCDGALAWLDLIIDGKAHRLLFSDDPKVAEFVAEFPDTYDAQGATNLGHRFVMEAGAIEQLAFRLAGKIDGGWVGSSMAEGDTNE